MLPRKRRRMKGRLLVILLALLVAGCGGSPLDESSASLGLSATPTPSPAVSEEAESAEEPATPKVDEVVKLGKTVIRAKKGRPWEMEAVKIDWDDTLHQGRATDVDWDLLDEEGKVVVNVKAPGALCEMDSERVTFEGRVVARRQAEGDVLTVNHLVWEGQQGKFFGSGGVRWSRGDSTMVGDEIITDAGLDQVELVGNVRARTVLGGGNDEN